MLGQLVRLARRRPVVVMVLRRDPRGWWVGAERIGGRVRKDALRVFKGEEIDEVLRPEGWQKTLEGVIQ